ncbi:MAG: sulfatase-like hydrolase/transferase [Cyclobacteriaceae bacterium]
MKYTFLLLSCFFIQKLSFSQDSPNFIFILADDQGWTGTSVLMDPDNPDSKSDYYETPNLERLAASGMRFSSAYAPSPKCSPSRMSIITGQTTARNHFTNTSSMVTSGKTLIEPSSSTSITSDEFTLPEYLKSLTDHNYTTAHFGKWHLGSDLPEAHGFDESDGANSNNDGNSGSSINEDPKGIFDITQKGIDFMSEAIAADRPFYIRLSHYAVHTDIESTQASFDKYEAKPKGRNHDGADYAAMTEDLDAGVGLILDFIEEQQLQGTTYIIYTSDNGGQINVTSNDPLRLGKTMIFEGGIRVPLIISGPGITANSHSSAPVVGYDFYPTIADLIGGDLSSLPNDLDGTSFKGILDGTSNELTKDQPLIFHSPHYENNANKTPRSAIIDGDEKLLVEYETGDRLHYALNEDIDESNNTYSASSEISTSLLLTLRDYLKSVEAQMPTFSLTEADTDEDGLPDSWEFEQLLGTLFDGSDDPDGDGLDNSDEYDQGKDPLVSDAGIGLLSTSKHTPLKLYPNPVRDFLQVLTDIDGMSLTLYDLGGRLILQQTEINSTSSVSTVGIPKGVFMYQIKNQSEEIIAKGRLIKE